MIEPNFGNYFIGVVGAMKVQIRLSLSTILPVDGARVLKSQPVTLFSYNEE